DEGHAGVEAGLGVVLLRLLRADRQVGDEDIGPGPAQGLGHVDRRGRRLLAGLPVVLAPPVERRAPEDLDAEVPDLGEADGVVLAPEDGLAEVLADLGVVHVEGADELHVADVVAAELHVHQAGDAVAGVGVAVVLDALHEAAGAVADAGDGDADPLGHVVLPWTMLSPALMAPCSAAMSESTHSRSRSAVRVSCSIRARV